MKIWEDLPEGLSKFAYYPNLGIMSVSSSHVSCFFGLNLLFFYYFFFIIVIPILIPIAHFTVGITCPKNLTITTGLLILPLLLTVGRPSTIIKIMEPKAQVAKTTEQQMQTKNHPRSYHSLVPTTKGIKRAVERKVSATGPLTTH